MYQLHFLFFSLTSLTVPSQVSWPRSSSSPRPFGTGVPEGSTLAPLSLFNQNHYLGDLTRSHGLKYLFKHKPSFWTSLLNIRLAWLTSSTQHLRERTSDCLPQICSIRRHPISLMVTLSLRVQIKILKLLWTPAFLSHYSYHQSGNPIGL